MNYIVYKTTNHLNNKIYIGIHKQETLEFDGYYGSGILLNRAIEKYGEEHFEREILFCFNNLEDARCKERELVTEDFCKSRDNYNISVGGTGGNTMAGYSDEEKREVYLKVIKTKRDRGTINYSGEELEKARERMRKIRIQPDNRGRVHTAQSIQNMKDSRRKFCWITNGYDNVQMFLDDDKEIEIPDGWRRGMTVLEENKFTGHTEEVLRELSKKRKGKRYITDGNVNKIYSDGDEIPEGWYFGLTRHKKEKRFFITNGVESRKILINDEIPEGWYKGRTFNSGKKHE